MAGNQILTPDIVTKETLVLLENNLVMAGTVDRRFENQFHKIGSKLTIRKPNKFLVNSGPALAIQDIVEPSVTVTVDQQKHVDFNFATADQTLAIEEFSDRYLKPASSALANHIDAALTARYADIHTVVGTPGTTPNSWVTSVQPVGLALDLAAAPQDTRTLVLGPAAYWATLADLKNAYVKSVAEPAFKGLLVNVGNFNIYMDQNVQTHTVGNYAGTPTVATAGQTGSSLVTNGWTAGGTLKKGDVITIAGVFGVNPQSRQSTGVLQCFVITADTTLAAANSALPISPAMVTSGTAKNVSGSPAAGAAIVVRTGPANSNSPQNLGYTKECFGLVTVPLDIPQNLPFGGRETYKDISMRFISDYIIGTDTNATRIDVLFGTAVYYPELGVRLVG